MVKIRHWLASVPYHSGTAKGTLLLALSLLWVVQSCQDPLYDPPKSPGETLATFRLDDRLVIELYAAEPHIRDPVDMTIDAKGRVYVVEMPDYPFKPEPGQGKGRIRQLHDMDGDGTIDSASTFIQNISEITSILPWEDGMLIAAAPNILFAADRDGDGQADTTEVLFTGFFENNSEAQITNLKFGIDNWVYAANNGQGGEIRYTRDPEQPARQIQGGDFRFRLDRGRFEVASGPAQFGHAFNDRGHRFVTQNTMHLRQIVIPWRYLHRHPYLPSTTVAHNISDHEAEMFQETPPPYWRAERTRRRQKSYDERNLGRIEYAEDYFTGCSGGTFYAGHTFPEAFLGNIFTGEVAGNLIHRDVLEPSAESPVYIASRADTEQEREFLSSTDSWFRPTHFYVGPRGGLHVVDFYRQHIETPLSIPVDLKEDMDFMRGSDMGRIYYIRPAGDSPVPSDQDLTELSSRALVDLLQHPNRWHRRQAQRLILHRQDMTMIPMLRKKFEDASMPQARLHALYALEGLGALDEDLVRRAMEDPEAGLREHGLMLAEHYPNLLSPMVGLLADPDLRVAFQACLSLGQFEGAAVRSGLRQAYQRYGSDRWFRMAILSSDEGSSQPFMRDLSRVLDPSREHDLAFVQDFSHVVGHRKQADEVLELCGVIQGLSSPGNQALFAAMEEGLIAGVAESKEPLVFDNASDQMARLEALPAYEALLVRLQGQD